MNEKAHMKITILLEKEEDKRKTCKKTELKLVSENKDVSTTIISTNFDCENTVPCRNNFA